MILLAFILFLPLPLLAAAPGSSLTGPLAVATADGTVMLTPATTNSTILTNLDTVLVSNVFTGGTYGQNYWLSGPEGYTFVSADTVATNVCAVRGDGLVQYVSAGTATIRVILQDGSGRQSGSVLNLNTAASSGTSSQLDFNSFVAGSVASNALATLRAATNGTSTALWTSGTNRNPAFWLSNAVSLSAIPYNSRGVLIASNALLCASHVAPTNGTLFWFSDTNGAIQSASVLASTNLGFDLTVALLSTNLWTVRPVPLVPTNWLAYARCASNSIGLPILAERQNYNLYSYVSRYCGPTNWTAYTDFSYFPGWSATTTGGDSGHPLFVMANGDLALIGTWFYASSGNTAASFLGNINSALTNLATASNQPTNAAVCADWSGFITP